jgi:predicted nucleotide-binding protein (sugar kinase/HSP70/actin superfamily)
MAGGIGPCRFGLYGEVQKETLRSLGYDLPFIVIEPPKKHFTEVIQNFTRFLGGSFWRNLPRAVRICWHKAKVTDELDKIVLSLAPHLSLEWRKRLWMKRDEFLAAIDQTGKVGRLKAILTEAEELFASFPQEHRGEVLRVIVVGEIYTVLEPAVNFQVERTLSLMGIEVTRTIYISEWIWQQVILNFLRVDWQKDLREQAKPYLSRFIGGHGLETVAYTVRAADERYDGVVQLAPLGCMPEVVAMSIIGQVSKDRQIPVLSLLLDEHTAEAGALTRIEAFVDLIQNKQAWAKCARS